MCLCVGPGLDQLDDPKLRHKGRHPISPRMIRGNRYAELESDLVPMYVALILYEMKDSLIQNPQFFCYVVYIIIIIIIWPG